MSGLQEFVSGQVGYQPQWLHAPSIEPPKEKETTFSYYYYSNLIDLAHPADIQESMVHSTLADSSWEYYQRAHKWFYEYLLHVTPRGYQPVIPSVASNFGYLRRRLKASSDAVKNSVDMNLQIMHGNPVFRGTRIPIYQVIDELADGTPLREIPKGYPSLTVEQIQNGLDFAASVLRIYDEQISNR